MLDFFRQLDYGYLDQLLMSLIPAVLCLSVHESAHGLAAHLLGDDTAKSQGRISLNPLRHVDLMGLVMLAIARIGWAKPVSVDLRKLKRPKRDFALTALAGPASNFLFAGVCWCVLALVFKLHPEYSSYALSEMLELLDYASFSTDLLFMLTSTWAAWLPLTLVYVVMRMNLGLGIFNLIPIPPLDGSRVVLAFLPDRLYYKVLKYERYGMVILVIGVLLWNYLPSVLQR